jgi:hypothetical protein
MGKNMKRNLFLFVFAVLLSAFGASSASAAPAEKLSIQRLVFADEVVGLGQYTPRPTPRFTTEEACLVYVETAGFAMPLKPKTEDEYSVNLAVDLALKLPQSGRKLALVPDVTTLVTTARSHWAAYYLAFTLDLAQVPPSSYVLEVGVRDNIGGQVISRDLALQVAEPTEADIKARQEREAEAQRQQR